MKKLVLYINMIVLFALLSVTTIYKWSASAMVICGELRGCSGTAHCDGSANVEVSNCTMTCSDGTSIQCGTS
jgi:hypothetical protein